MIVTHCHYFLNMHRFNKGPRMFLYLEELSFPNIPSIHCFLRHTSWVSGYLGRLMTYTSRSIRSHRATKLPSTIVVLKKGTTYFAFPPHLHSISSTRKPLLKPWADARAYNAFSTDVSRNIELEVIYKVCYA